MKTRLCPPLSVEDAARVHSLFLRETIATCRAAAAEASAALTIHYAPETGEGYFAETGLRLEAQRGVDLGERMYRSIRVTLDAGYCPVVLLGTDIPALNSVVVGRALQVLLERDAVLGPTEDGGYYLIGFRIRPQLQVFEGIPWSTPEVMRVTRQRLVTTGLTFGEIDRLRDVDTVEDLFALGRGVPASFSTQGSRELQRILRGYRVDAGPSDSPGTAP